MRERSVLSSFDFESEVGTMETNFENKPFEDERENYQRKADSCDVFAERVRSN
jgi:hypothetical protein